MHNNSYNEIYIIVYLSLHSCVVCMYIGMHYIYLSMYAWYVSMYTWYVSMYVYVWYVSIYVYL